jgi:hypothetical protein
MLISLERLVLCPVQAQRQGSQTKPAHKDRAFANRELKRVLREQGQIDSSQAKLPLAQLCDRYLETLSGLSLKL